MKCAKLRLQERTKTTNKAVTPDKPRRYCQKRMVNPDHEEDPRWIDVLQRFHCNNSDKIDYNETYDNSPVHQDYEDLFLSVQNLKFQGNEKHTCRPRTSFKYKKITDSNKHRMFVKQVVQEPEQVDEDSASQLTCYYFDDYAKYLQCTDQSRPSSGASSIVLQGLGNTNKENKSQGDVPKAGNVKKLRKELKIKDPQDYFETRGVAYNGRSDVDIEETKVAFHKSGNRRSLTISRAQSPETVQVIRVEVICNYSSSTMSDYEEKKPLKPDIRKDKKADYVNVKSSHFGNKYLLTNTTKTLDERVSGGDKVTLLCKTFRLSDRTKMLWNKNL